MKKFSWPERAETGAVLAEAIDRLNADERAAIAVHSGRVDIVAFASIHRIIAAARTGEFPNSVAKAIQLACADLAWPEKKYGRLPARARAVIEAIVLQVLEEHAPPNQNPEVAALASPERIDVSVSAVIRQYGFNARGLGGPAADSWTVADIARETSGLVPPGPDGERAPAWQPVHDTIRRRFNRFVIHVDDSEPLPDGAYQVWIKGWDCWVPAKIERDGQTWKLPIGRVSAEVNGNMVAAVRPA